LLDFEDEAAGVNGVEAAAGDEEAVALVDGNAVGERGEFAGAQRGFELGAGDAVLEAGDDGGAWRGLGDEPVFGLGFAGKSGRFAGGRMDLEGHALAGVEPFDEDGETLRGFPGRAHDGGGFGFEKVAQRAAGPRAAGDLRLGLGAVNDFPAFADDGAGWERTMEDGLERAAAPDAFLIEGNKAQELGDGGHGH
jgi:hypothetical protein